MALQPRAAPSPEHGIPPHMKNPYRTPEAGEVIDAAFMANDSTGFADRVNRVAFAEDDWRLQNLKEVWPRDRWSMLPKVQENPPARAGAGQEGPSVTMYRGVPDDVRSPVIRPGDWVTLNPVYARGHGSGRTGKTRVIQADAPVGDLVWAGTDENEFFYAPTWMKGPPGEPAVDLVNRVGVDVFINGEERVRRVLQSAERAQQAMAVAARATPGRKSPGRP